MRALVMMLVCSAAVAAEPLYTYDFEAEDAAVPDRAPCVS